MTAPRHINLGSTSAAATTMDTETAPRLLSVPREIRNRIYEECSLTVTISRAAPAESAATPSNAPWQPRVKLSRTTALSLLLVCGQIHDECMERANDDKPSALLIDLVDCNLFKAVSDLDLATNVPAAVLKRVKRCRLTISWAQVVDAKRSGFRSWCSQASTASSTRLTELHQQSKTPTKAMCDALQLLLALVHNLVYGSARVTIAASFNGHPDTIPSLTASDRAHRESLLKCFDPCTFLALQTHEAITWPPPPKLRLTCYIPIPMYSVCRSDDTGDLNEVGDITDRTGPGRTVMVVWELTPSSDSNNWQGFQPTMIGTSDQVLLT
ncbi:hypothetical protein LTR27_012481 [Elasticomyces elasticus]|nr:hypothetical protein LTR27_012481 [Elasticomyces elasticus]